MSVLSSLKGVLLGSLIALPSVAQAQAAADPNCWRAEEVEAARFEDFRLKLMVGALNCKNYFPTVAATYNAFMQAKKELILANLYVVRAHFIREAGTAEGATSFANYQTLAGNKYSTTLYDRAKCETIDAYTRVVAAASDTDLIKLVDALSPGPLPSGCKVTLRRDAPAVMAVAAVAPPTLATAPAVIGPMTQAERIAASTAATRRLLAARALARSAAASPAVVAAPVPAVAPVAPAAEEATAIPAALLIAEPQPAPEPIKAAVAAEPARPAAIASPSAAQALAEAAKALAAAAAAMQQPGVN